VPTTSPEPPLHPSSTLRIGGPSPSGWQGPSLLFRIRGDARGLKGRQEVKFLRRKQPVPSQPARESGERCKLPQWGMGWSPGGYSFLAFHRRQMASPGTCWGPSSVRGGGHPPINPPVICSQIKQVILDHPTVGSTFTRPASRAAATAIHRYLLPAPDLSSKPAGPAKVNAFSVINWTVVRRTKLTVLATVDASVSQRLSSSVYSTTPSRGSICDRTQASKR